MSYNRARNASFLILISIVVRAQTLLWIDTLCYSSCTGVGLLQPGVSKDVIAFGVLSDGYSAPTLSNRRNFLLNTQNNGTKTFLDSSTTGGSVGLAFDKQIYKCLRLHTLNSSMPIIGGTIYPEGIYLVKFDLTGKVIWAHKQPFHAIPNQIAVDRNGLIYVQYSNGNGGFFCKYNSDGEKLPCQFPSGLNPLFDKNNNLFLTGFNSQLRKLDYSGNLLWSKYAPNDASIAVDDEGSCYVVTRSQTVVQKYSSSGELRWTKSLPETGLVAPRIEGTNLYLAGVYGDVPPSLGNFVCKLDMNTGEVIWQTNVPYPSYRPFKFNALTSNNGIVYFSASEPDPGASSTILVAIEDISYIPVTTSLPSNQKKAGALNIAPNPSNGTVRVVYCSEGGTGSEVRVLDALGREVYRSPVNGFAESSEQTLELSHLPPGVYLLEVTANGRALDSKRLVIQ